MGTTSIRRITIKRPDRHNHQFFTIIQLELDATCWYTVDRYVKKHIWFPERVFCLEACFEDVGTYDIVTA